MVDQSDDKLNLKTNGYLGRILGVGVQALFQIFAKWYSFTQSFSNLHDATFSHFRNILKRMVKNFIVDSHNFLWNRSLYFFWSFLYLFNPNDFNFLPKRSIKMFVNHKFWVIDQSNNFFMICLLYLFHCCDRPTKGSVE